VIRGALGISATAVHSRLLVCRHSGTLDPTAPLRKERCRRGRLRVIRRLTPDCRTPASPSSEVSRSRRRLPCCARKAGRHATAFARVRAARAWSGARLLRTTSRRAGRDCCSATKGAVCSHPADSRRAIELDETEQPAGRLLKPLLRDSGGTFGDELTDIGPASTVAAMEDEQVGVATAGGRPLAPGAGPKARLAARVADRSHLASVSPVAGSRARRSVRADRLRRGR
jgi:hypothetical protein